MDAKLFRNFQAFVQMADDDTPIDQIIAGITEDQYQHGDPTGGQWRRMGFIEIEEGSFDMDVQGAGRLICVQLNERILPGAVVREKMIERIASIEDREGRKVGKKEYAALKDEIAFELLPQSHIRRKLIPIMFVDKYVLIFTTSAKLCDDIMALLYRATKVPQLQLAHLGSAVKNSIGGTLTSLAREGSTDIGDNDEDYFQTDSSAVLKGENKKTIRIKDKSVQDHDIQQLLKQEYTVTQLGIEFWEPGMTEATCGFSLNDHLAFSTMKLTGVEANSRETDDRAAADKFMSTAWLTATTARSVIQMTTRLMGGLRAASEMAKDKEKITVPLDDLVRENAEAEHPEEVEDPDEL